MIWENTFYLKMCLILKKFFMSQERLAYASVTDKPGISGAFIAKFSITHVYMLNVDC